MQEGNGMFQTRTIKNETEDNYFGYGCAGPLKRRCSKPRINIKGIICMWKFKGYF